MWPAIEQLPGLSAPKPLSCADTVPWWPLISIRMDGTSGNGHNPSGPGPGWNTDDVMPDMVMEAAMPDQPDVPPAR
eukprot:CAMPEP_0119117644 /NCGR_PEP_ID=MMETSP1180-20130426/52952_1 /TAXON_ID=3052 ORGANISM="Chlamydomonas cf sp, Strain CCMP681" /NCGR_SAMPLE_ID=MMETSP1180 /ASSEMBLY_ACC=CAM_ASM_000741 /LENGTH=75 /DNA_ID=CAMNT_0007106921 /DNA_START=419 /DNA_END=646 /DNA_ORIENTATION=+